MVERGFVEQVEEASIINELEIVCSTSKESNTQEVFYSFYCLCIEKEELAKVYVRPNDIFRCCFLKHVVLFPLSLVIYSRTSYRRWRWLFEDFCTGTKL